MHQDYKYFVIPFNAVPVSPPYPVWYATWSKTRPHLQPGMGSPVVVGVVMGELPKDAILLGTSTKDPDPPPPPLSARSVSLSDYQHSVKAWLELGRGW